MAEDNTQELLDRYGRDRFGERIDQDEELSLYSEDSIFRDNFSPSKSSSPLKTDKKSTNKKSFFTPRLQRTSLYSPERKPSGVTGVGSPLRNAFNSLSDMSMNQDVHNFVHKSVLDFQDKNEEDKTELLIRETHKVVNDIPKSVLDNDEIVEYQKLVRITIEKLAKKCEELSSENEKLSKNDDKPIIQSLQEKVKTLMKSNTMYKNEVAQQSDEFMKMLNESNELKRENDLLRNKLIKYKNLYDAKQRVNGRVSEADEEPKPSLKSRAKEQKNQAQRDNKKVRSQSRKEKMVQLYNDMAEILNKEKKSRPQVYDFDDLPEFEFQSESEYDASEITSTAPEMLKQFEKVIKEQQRQEVKKPDGDLGKVIQHNNELYEKLIGILSRTESGSSHAQHSPEAEVPESQIKPPQAPIPSTSVSEPTLNASADGAAEKQDVILQCYLCCNNIHDTHKSETRPVSSSSMRSEERRKCERCSSINNTKKETKGQQRNPSGFGIDLMGEYKWTL